MYNPKWLNELNKISNNAWYDQFDGYRFTLLKDGDEVVIKNTPSAPQIGTLDGVTKDEALIVLNIIAELQ